MANLIKDQTPHRSVLIPLQLRETNGNRTPKNAMATKAMTPSKNDTNDLGKIFFFCLIHKSIDNRIMCVCMQNVENSKWEETKHKIQAPPAVNESVSR